MENQNQEFKIYSVPTYKKVVYKRTETTPEYVEEAKPYKSTDVKKIIKELKKDKQYHQRLFKDDILKINIDIDGLPKEMYDDLQQRMADAIWELDENLEFELAYTRNENGKKNIETNTKNFIYSHITFCGLSATSSHQKTFWDNFVKKYPEYKGFVDFGHLGSEKWYRLPDQTKEQKKNTEHFIKAGEMNDFILHDVANDVNIDEKIFNKVNNKLKAKEEKKEYARPENWKPAEIKPEDKKLVELAFSKMDMNDYNDWIKTCWLLKNVGFGFDVFDEISAKGALKYSGSADCQKQWDRTKPAKIDIGLIHHMAKNADPIKYAELGLNYQAKKDVKFDDIIKFSRRYLLEDENIQKINDKNDILQNQFINLFQDANIKSLSLKSPYGTGKTQLIKKIITTFEPKKILWLSYRKTLTNNILNGEGFGEEFGFKSYLDRKLDADRLIIQLESILKLGGNMDFLDENVEYPSYDLVIIDEVESILKQFSSPTFKGNSKECFDFVNGVITNSNKLLVLDGDVSNRTYKYIDHFGKSIKLENDIKINKRVFNVTEDRSNFTDKICDDLDNDKKVVIVSMPSTDCDTFKKLLTEKYPKKTILSYTGSSADSTKKDFNNVDEIWATADVLIYSPTCEAGVNFDKKHFQKMYGILTDGSTTPRGFLQMCARIRKLENNEILLLNDGKFSNHIVDAEMYFYFEEVKNSILALEGIQLKTVDVVINGKLCKSTKLTPYDVNYIYNRVEELNANKYYFLSYLEMMCINKGHDFNRLKDKPTKKALANAEAKVIDVVNNAQHLLIAEDIDNDTYLELLQKQNKDDATEEDKRQITRFCYKKALGIDILNNDNDGEEFVKKFDKDVIKKFVSLIDADNIKESTDNQTKEYKDKANLINDLIKQMGFTNIFDDKTIFKTDFEPVIENIIKNNVLFTNQLNTQVRFNLNKTKKIENSKQFLGFVNSILNGYSVKLTYCQERNGGKNKVGAYKMFILNDINELLEYKIRKGFKLVDKANIRPKATTETYKEFIDMEKLEKLEADRATRKAEKEAQLKALAEYAFNDDEKENPLDYGL